MANNINQNPINQFNYGLALSAMMGFVLLVSALLVKYLIFTDIDWQRWLGIGLVGVWLLGFCNYLLNRRPVEHSIMHFMWCLVVGGIAASLGFLSMYGAVESGCPNKWTLAIMNLSASVLLFLGAWQHWESK